MHEWGTYFKCFDEYFNGKFTNLYCEQKFKKPKKFHPKSQIQCSLLSQKTQSKGKHIIHGYPKQVNSKDTYLTTKTSGNLRTRFLKIPSQSDLSGVKNSIKAISQNKMSSHVQTYFLCNKVPVNNGLTLGCQKYRHENHRAKTNGKPEYLLFQ